MKNKAQIIILGIGFAFFIGWNFFMLKKNNKENLSYKFNGIVESVNYDVKGIPSVVIQGDEYYLSGGWNFEHLIEKRDSLQKKEGEMVVKLIKRDRKIYIFKD
ncbi:hypothetical protein [Pedobacter nutrimenti]|uniref:hypothetical protein n=1 Tax=Pedobacter nutrimenti TaxID=1241337 RepID=UPI00292D09F8|nr:hypothetical protein [Pedobacter nutrimenti]